MTNKIYYLQEHMTKYPFHSRIKVILKETIERRGKWLRYLRMWDYRRFEWVLEKLNLVYKPMPE
jgi:small subunit ribosomal protein S15